MRIIATLTIAICLLIGCTPTNQTSQIKQKTICNPVDLSYRFCIDTPSRREAADPTIVKFKDKFILFASKSGGYWYSDDLIEWTLIETNEIPVEDYAPTAIVIKDTLYFLASLHELNTIYKSADPLSGKWTVAREKIDQPVWDPAFFLDDDNRLYLYWGCSNQAPLYGVEVDYNKNFSFIGSPIELKYANPEQNGWEVPGDYNTIKDRNPWIEGAWINKNNGKYYLQYAGPGTEFKSYSDGVYVSDSPLGPYTMQSHNPFAYKPEGFAAGAGHGNTFEDNYGNYWHIGTMSISQKHMFERRLGLFPVFFDKEGTLYATTKYGDYPMIVPKKKISDFNDIFPGWMLLSFEKSTTVSSQIDSLPSSYMTNEDIRTYWAAKSGDKGEFAILDLGNSCDVYAVQINFAEYNTSLFGRQKDIFHKYIVEYSNDNSTWEMLVDKSENNNDNSHDYTELPEKVTCRYLKISNIEVPSGNFAISGFRVFGKGNGEKPANIETFEVYRNSEDKREVKLIWNKLDNATGYNISYGPDKNKLYQNYIVYKDTSVTINTLNTELDYCFSIEAFNENGITQKDTVVTVK